MIAASLFINAKYLLQKMLSLWRAYHHAVNKYPDDKKTLKSAYVVLETSVTPYGTMTSVSAWPKRVAGKDVMTVGPEEERKSL